MRPGGGFPGFFLWWGTVGELGEGFQEACDAFLGFGDGVVVVLAPGDAAGEGGDGDGVAAFEFGG